MSENSTDLKENKFMLWASWTQEEITLWSDADIEDYFDNLKKIYLMLARVKRRVKVSSNQNQPRNIQGWVETECVPKG